MGQNNSGIGLTHYCVYSLGFVCFSEITHGYRKQNQWKRGKGVTHNKAQDQIGHPEEHPNIAITVKTGQETVWLTDGNTFEGPYDEDVT
ncbi:hypothetical protein HAX54_031811 [Datura stramonium]|uniref:Uncharacterized protein n=1 Tax=Datura stramonium TaxID=4076 RepID=A0ABS8SC60_DATST|nr:hypothetical protein [Datura stramonium]